MFWAIILLFISFLYFYFRLGEESTIRKWIDSHAIQIGNGFIVVWLIYFFLKSPKLAVYYGIPLLAIGTYMTLKKRKEKNNDDGSSNE